MLFVIRNPEIQNNCIAMLKTLEPYKAWDVTIGEHKTKRSGQQNRLYWSWMNIIGKDSGLSKDDMHATFSIRLLGPELFVVDGKQYIRAKSTTSLSTKEFTDYLDKIHATAMNLDIRLPMPEFFGLELQAKNEPISPFEGG